MTQKLWPDFDFYWTTDKGLTHQSSLLSVSKDTTLYTDKFCSFSSVPPLSAHPPSFSHLIFPPFPLFFAPPLFRCLSHRTLLLVLLICLFVFWPGHLVLPWSLWAGLLLTLGWWLMGIKHVSWESPAFKCTVISVLDHMSVYGLGLYILHLV